MWRYVPYVSVLGFFLLLTLILFREFIFGRALLLTTDAAITSQEYYTKPLLDVFAANWRDTLLVGKGHPISIQLTLILVKLLGTITWNNLMWPIAASLSSFAMLLYFRSRKVCWVAGLVACLCAFWLGSNFTLLYAGHGQKFFVLFFFTLGIAFAQRVATTGRWYDAVLFGSFAAAMFAHQADVALFCALFLGPYILFRLLRKHGWKSAKVYLPLAIAVAPALLIGARPLLQGYQQNVRDVSVVQKENPEEKWNYVTQWSWPPEESLAFIAPGYTGWRSGDAEGPYWGRMGRSAGFESTQKGFRNFKLESTYLGMIPVAFALFALWVARESRHRTEIYFWAAAAGVAFLLACGKYLPLYALFYQLPAVNVIRNPNKFLQIFQVSLAILAGYGVHALLAEFDRDRIRARARSFGWGLAGFTVLLLLVLMTISAAQSEGIARYTADQFPPALARLIVTQKIHALLHAAVMAAGVWGLFALFTHKRTAAFARGRSLWLGAALVLVMTLDVSLLSRHYIKTMPRSYIEANDLTRTVAEVSDHHRVSLLSQENVYQIWITYLFPYQGIQMFNTASMPRMPKDYEAFFRAVGGNPVRMWQLAGVKFLIGPEQVAQSIPPQLATSIARFQAGGTADGEMVVQSSAEGPHHLLKMTQPAPRYVLIAGSERVSDETALARLADPAYALFEKLMLPEGSDAPVLPGSGICGTVEVLSYRPGRVRLKVQSEQPAYLRLADRYDADWQAHLNDQVVEVFPADFLFQAVHIPAGLHTVELRYAPSRRFFHLQCAGILVGLCAFAALVVAAVRDHEAGSD